MNDSIDLLQIKIERAKRELPEATQKAISAVDWKSAIVSMREKKGYTFEQLGDLEVETELVLCGLADPADYSKELEKRMGISASAANELANEMNNLVFKNIRAELIKNLEQGKNNPEITKPSAAREPLPKEEVTTPPIKKEPVAQKEEEQIKPPLLTQKLSGYVKNEVVETDHSLHNLPPSPPQDKVAPVSKVDPYREVPE